MLLSQGNGKITGGYVADWAHAFIHPATSGGDRFIAPSNGFVINGARKLQQNYIGRATDDGGWGYRLVINTTGILLDPDWFIPIPVKKGDSIDSISSFIFVPFIN